MEGKFNIGGLSESEMAELAAKLEDLDLMPDEDALGVLKDILETTSPEAAKLFNNMPEELLKMSLAASRIYTPEFIKNKSYEVIKMLQMKIMQGEFSFNDNPMGYHLTKLGKVATRLCRSRISVDGIPTPDLVRHMASDLIAASVAKFLIKDLATKLTINTGKRLPNGKPIRLPLSAIGVKILFLNFKNSTDIEDRNILDRPKWVEYCKSHVAEFQSRRDDDCELIIPSNISASEPDNFDYHFIVDDNDIGLGNVEYVMHKIREAIYDIEEDLEV